MIDGNAVVQPKGYMIRTTRDTLTAGVVDENRFANFATVEKRMNA